MNNRDCSNVYRFSCVYLICALFFKETSFNFMYLVSRWFLMEIYFCRAKFNHCFFLNFNFCLEIFFRGAYKSNVIVVKFSHRAKRVASNFDKEIQRIREKCRSAGFTSNLVN